MSSAVTRLPSSLRNRFSSRILVEKGSLETAPTPLSSKRASRKISYSAALERSFAAAPKLFFGISLIIEAGSLKFPPDSVERVSVAIQTQTKLESLVEGFDRDTAGSRSRISELLERDPRSFQSGVVRVLKSPSSSRGLQYVVSLVVASDFLMATLCDPALSLEEAVALARTALQMDSMTDVNLARKLADDSSLGSPLPNAGRLMDVLGEISAGSRITSSLMRLLRNSDPELRSKAVLLIGRSSRSIKWLQNRMGEGDPRTRANAVEALWGVDTVEARELLRSAVMDSNNRVAGNAVFALHCIGDTSSIPEVFKMAASESPLFR